MQNKFPDNHFIVGGLERFGEGARKRIRAEIEPLFEEELKHAHHARRGQIEREMEDLIETKLKDVPVPSDESLF